MMMLKGLFDDWIGSDDRDVLAHWDHLVSGLVGARQEPGDEPTFGEMAERFASIREQGWLDIALDEETPDSLYFEVLKRLHRRDLPLPVPLLEVWSAIRLLRRVGGPAADALLERTRDGDAIPILAIEALFGSGHSGWVPFGRGGTVILPVPEEDGLAIFAVTERTGTWEKVNAPDPTLPSTAVGADPDAERLGLLGGTELDDARADVLVSQAAALAGQSQAMLDSTVAYLTTREQFGVPIGSFQALRHRAADCATEVYAAQQLSIHAAAELRRHREPLALGQLAKAFVGQAALKMASEAVQLHGGMGFTWEGGVHFGLKRIMHLAMTGPTVAECEEHLGRRALSSDALLWAGGLDDDGDSRSPNDTEDG